MSGVLSITGHPGGPPTRPGYSIGDMAGGMFTAIGVLSALVERDRSGLGQRIDVSMLDAQVALLENAVVRYFATGEVPARIGTRHPLVTPFQAFATSDGYLVVANVKNWVLFCATIDADVLALDPRFETPAARNETHGVLEPLLAAAFARRTTAAWLAVLDEVCLAAPLNSIPDMARDPQVLHRGMFADLDTPGGERLRVSGSPVKLSRTPAGPWFGADAPGGHTREILAAHLGLNGDALVSLEEEGVIGPRVPPA